MTKDARVAGMLRLQALIKAAQEELAALIEDRGGGRITDEEHVLLSVSALLAKTLTPQSLADGVRWANAFLAGEEAWVLLRSVPGKPAVVTYYGHLTREQQRVLGGR